MIGEILKIITIAIVSAYTLGVRHKSLNNEYYANEVMLYTML